MKSDRIYGIDLLRLILMYMVCLLHILGQGGILQACQPGTISHNAFWFLETAAYCAANGFALISGFIASDKPRKFNKLAELWFQVVFYSFFVTLILTLAGLNPSGNVWDIAKCLLPVTFNHYWYFTAFFVLYFAAPVLNRFLFTADEKTCKKALIILIILFSFMGLFDDPFKTYRGYSTLWLIILYCIGVLAKRAGVFRQKKTPTLILMWILCILLTWSAHVFLGVKTLMNYVSPTMLLCSYIMVVLFSRLRLKGTIVSKLSPLAFGIYLSQTNQTLWNITKNSLTFITETNVLTGIAYVFAFGLLLFIAGLIIEFLRSRLALLIRIPEISIRIVTAAEHFLEKAVCFLK